MLNQLPVVINWVKLGTPLMLLDLDDFCLQCINKQPRETWSFPSEARSAKIENQQVIPFCLFLGQGGLLFSEKHHFPPNQKGGLRYCLRGRGGQLK